MTDVPHAHHMFLYLSLLPADVFFHDRALVQAGITHKLTEAISKAAKMAEPGSIDGTAEGYSGVGEGGGMNAGTTGGRTGGGASLHLDSRLLGGSSSGSLSQGSAALLGGGPEEGFFYNDMKSAAEMVAEIMDRRKVRQLRGKQAQQQELGAVLAFGGGNHTARSVWLAALRAACLRQRVVAI